MDTREALLELALIALPEAAFRGVYLQLQRPLGHY
jgi:hypothetical protein